MLCTVSRSPRPQPGPAPKLAHGKHVDVLLEMREMGLLGPLLPTPEVAGSRVLMPSLANAAAAACSNIASMCVCFCRSYRGRLC